MYVCMSVCYGFTIEIYGFAHSIRVCTQFSTSSAHAAHDAITIEAKVKDLEDRRRRQNESRCMEDS